LVDRARARQALTVWDASDWLVVGGGGGGAPASLIGGSARLAPPSEKPPPPPASDPLEAPPTASGPAPGLEPTRRFVQVIRSRHYHRVVPSFT